MHSLQVQFHIQSKVLQGLDQYQPQSAKKLIKGTIGRLKCSLESNQLKMLRWQLINRKNKCFYSSLDKIIKDWLELPKILTLMDLSKDRFSTSSLSNIKTPNKNHQN